MSIVGFIFAGMTALSSFAASAALSSMVGPDNPFLKIGATGITIVYLLFAAAIFYPSFKLYGFSVAATQAILFGEQSAFNVAMSKLKSYFKFWGILTISFIVLYIMMIIFVVVAGVAVAGHGAA